MKDKKDKIIIILIAVIIILIGALIFKTNYSKYYSEKGALLRITNPVDEKCTGCMRQKTITIYNQSSGKVNSKSHLIIRSTYLDGKKKKVYKVRDLKYSEYKKIYDEIKEYKDDNDVSYYKKSAYLEAELLDAKGLEFYMDAEDFKDFDKLYAGDEV